MITGNQATHSLNIGLHVFILFTFLIIFFFTFTAQLEKDIINSELKSFIKDNVKNTMTNIDSLDKDINQKSTIDWEKINNLAAKIDKASVTDSPSIAKNNKKLLILGIVSIITIFFILTIAYIIFKFYFKLDINLKKIFIENLVLFSVIGVIEYLFFTKVSVKYIPVTPDFVVLTVLDRIKLNISNKFAEKIN
jgi:hypothetical protein